MKSDVKLNRRKFLQAGAVTAGALALSVASRGVANAQQAPQKIKWDAEYDVIVIGSGIAATVAALNAAERGAKTVMLEKMSVLGGSSAISNATIAVPRTDIQLKHGIKEDSPEIMYKDLMKMGENYNHPNLLKTLTENALPGYNYIVERGAKFNDYVLPVDGMTYKRLLQPEVNGEIGIMKPLREKYVALPNASIQKRVRVDELLFNEQGDVIGVKARTNYRFDSSLASDDIENKSGTVCYYKANRGVICATGGFEADLEFRALEFPHLKKTFTSQHPGATAGGYRLLANGGARMIHSTFYRPSYPVWNDMSFGIMIDPVSGKRYVNENAVPRLNIFLETAKVLEKNGRVIPVSILDADAVKMITDEPHFESNTKAGYISKHDSIESLAKYYNIPVNDLKNTIANYNKMVENKNDTEFGRNFKDTNYNKVDKAPFYAVQVRPNFNYCISGACMNERAEVISLNTNKPIKGLYVAGEAGSGVHGSMRLAGCSIADCVVYGMVAGTEAAKRKI